MAFEALTCGPRPTRYGGLSLDWLADPSILGFAVGLRRASGRIGSQRCLKVFVRRKRARQALTAPVPPRLHLPDLSHSVEIDVDELPSLHPHGVPAHPAGGNAIRAETAGAPWGSFSCLLRGRFDARTYLLSCGHVLAGGSAAVGDRLQIAGSGSNPSAAARLTDWTVPVASETGFPNTVDAAIAEIDHSAAVGSISAFQPTGISGDIRSGMSVLVGGAASGRQRGIVVCERATFAVETNMAGAGRRRFGFRDQILCRDNTAAGDSGACVVNDRGRAVGLHIWGSDGHADGWQDEVSVVTPFRAVLDAFAPARSLELLDDAGTEVVRSGCPPVDDLDDAIDVAARTIFGEARGEPPEGRLAIAEVIYNRAIKRSGRFGTSIEGVCRQPNQFSCWNPGDPNSARIRSISLADPEIADCVTIARDLVAGRVGTLTMGADHYHHRRVAPAYSRSRQPSAHIGNHLFFNDIP